MKRSALAALFFLAIFLPALLGCGPSAKERTVIAKLTESMETHCVGRFLIDLPKGFVESQGNYVQLIYGLDKNWTSVEVKVLANDINKTGFEAYIKKRAAEIAKESHEELHVSMLEAQKIVADNAVLLRRYEDNSLPDGFVSELYLLIDDLLVQAKEESFKGGYAPTEARLKKLATQMSKQADPTKAGKGFCLGPLVINGEQNHEVGTHEFESSDFFDIGWSVFSQAITPNEDTLLKRWDSKNGILEAMGGVPETVRRGATHIAGMRAEELLSKGKIYGVLSLLFSAESIRTDPGLAKPLFSVDLRTGGITAPNEESAKKSSWSVNEATAVWDAVIKSIRLRPGAV